LTSNTKHRLPIMTSLSFPITNLSSIKSLTSLNLKPIKLSDEQIGRLKHAEEMQYRKPVNLADHPSQKIYAEVIVNGKSVAKIYNGGGAETSNAAAGKLKNLPSMQENYPITGQLLAQQRAEEIAKALGGTVKKAPTAVTQAEWDRRPPIEFKIDYEAMERDQLAARRVDTRTLMDAQLLAAGNEA
jgi:hypothetical protein